MKVIIIEDEKLSAEHLTVLLQKIDDSIEVTHYFDSIKSVVNAFQSGLSAELIFMDIHLADGNSFEIFKHLSIEIPLIFTTAYDQYWMQVFQYQAVDYLLKPFSYPRFAEAMLNFAQLKHKLQQPVLAAVPAYKKRFLLRKGQSLSILPVTDILLIRAANGVLLATDKHNSVHILTEANLGDIESQLDPSEFFRLNRSDILHISSILQVEPYNKESVAVVLSCDKEPAISSKTRTAVFRKWLNQ